ncbi:hypothetical protein [Novosphingobium sp. ZW T3_23]|uniref:hypothetical protein n=1 Tax=Novosphingobium sp. ZW T3_23 TaxID=3378084 RepID=UPI003851C9C5
MIRAAILAALLAAPVPALAQVVIAPPASTANTATKSEVQAAQAAAESAAAAAAAAQAAIPVPASSVPGMEMVGGAAGSTNTYRRGDAVQPRISRTVTGTTGSAGTAAVTWPAMAAVPKLVVTPYVTAAETQVPTCYPVTGTVTTTGATIKCFRTQTLLGLGLIPFTVAPAGVQFDVLALPGS